VAVIDQSTRIVRREGALTAPVDEELVMLDPEQSLYYGLNEVATSIWELLERPCTVSEICGKLTEEYRVDPELCREQVSDFLRRLADARLVDLV
jgi:Coenzyme PQQ synthesis protein D (PqqD)